MNWRFWRRRDRDRELTDEIGAHLKMAIVDRVRRGESLPDATAAARREFGNLGTVKEVTRRTWSFAWLEPVAQDLRYAARGLRRSPGFVATVALTLALGIGVNAAIFSVLDHLFRPTEGVLNPDRVRRIYALEPYFGHPQTQTKLSYPAWRDLPAAMPPSVALAAYYNSNGPMRLGAGADGPKVGVEYIVGDYFGVLGVRPSRGRAFTPDEWMIEAPHTVAIISDQLWRTQFGHDPDVIGQTLIGDSVRYTIIGVAPPNFHGIDISAVDVWAPFSATMLHEARPDRYKGFNGYLNLFGRLPGSVDAHTIEAIATPLLSHDPWLGDSPRAVLADLRLAVSDPERLGQYAAIPTQIGAVAGIILFIACANIANLLLARAMRRRREFAIRATLGVTRGRLIRQLLTESALLSVIAGGAAVLVAVWVATALREGLFAQLRWPDAPANARVIVFIVLVTLVACLGAGLAPAIGASRADLNIALAGGAREGTLQRSRLRTGLLVAQTALAVVMLAGAGLFVRSLRNVESVDVGFDTAQLLMVHTSWVGPRPTSDSATARIQAAINARLPDAMERLAHLPGVEAVGAASSIPMTGAMPGVFVPGFDSLPKVSDLPVGFIYASPEYLTTVGARILAGRGLTAADRAGSALVVVITAAMAKALSPGESPLGKCVMLEKRDGPCRVVVGVVADQRTFRLTDRPAMHVFAPLDQSPRQERQSRTTVVRAARGRTSIVADEVRRDLDHSLAGLARGEVSFIEDRRTAQLRPWRLSAALFSAAGILALLVSALGVYSVLFASCRTSLA